MTSSSMLEGSYNGELHGLAESTRTNNVLGFFIPEIAQTFREKASLSSTVGGEREPTNSMYRRRNLDMCSIQKIFGCVVRVTLPVTGGIYAA